MALQFYRHGRLGEALTATLDEMIADNVLNDAAAFKVMRQFDRTFAGHLQSVSSCLLAPQSYFTPAASTRQTAL